MKKFFYYCDTMVQLLSLNADRQTIRTSIPNTSPEDFASIVQQSFAGVIKSAGDFDRNKQLVSN